MTPALDREEYVEQAYFFRILRERLEEKTPVQTVLESIADEILSTTRLPTAIGFIATEVKHTGLLSSGFAKLPHYFTPFQAFVVASTEDERKRFSIEIALLILEREATFRASPSASPAGLFVYEFETLCRNRLGYDEGLRCLREDAFYPPAWRDYVEQVRRHVGVVEISELIFVRSETYVQTERRRDPTYAPPIEPLFGEKEGKIARANRGRDPLYLFAALQRQLNYPEPPRARAKDDPLAQLGQLKERVRTLEQRLKLVEGEVRGTLDLSQFADLEKSPKFDDD